MPAPLSDEPGRWEALFADLEGQLAAEERLDLGSEVAERTRRERALIPAMARVAAQLGQEVTVETISGGRIAGRLDDLGADWVLLVDTAHGGRALLIPWAAVTAVLDPVPRAREARTARRFGLGSALRVLARDRAPVSVEDRGGRRRSGVVDVVGSDYFELVEHPEGERRPASAVRRRRLIPFGAVVSVRSST